MLNSTLQGLIVGFLEGQGVTNRGFAKVTGASSAAFGVYRNMKSAMGIDLLDKILEAYPELRVVIAEHLVGQGTGNSRQNITQEDITPKNVKNIEEQLEKTRDLNFTLNEIIKGYRSDIVRLNKRVAELEEENKRLRSSGAPADNAKK